MSKHFLPNNISLILGGIVFLILFPLELLSSVLSWTDAAPLELINTNEDNFAPSWNKFESKLYFNTISGKYSQFYTASINPDGSVSETKIAGNQLNQSGTNQSYISFFSDEEALFSRSKLYLKRPYLNMFKIYRKKQSWSKTVEEDSLNGEYFISHPAVSPDGKFMIYSSNKNSDGLDSDLWITYRTEIGLWGLTMPLEELNSPGNEITPFLLSPDTLLFATNGQFGPGGYDIYISTKADGVWQRPFLADGINTVYDESDPCLLPWGDLLFASNRPGGKGKLDIYRAKKSAKPQLVSANDSLDIVIETSLTSLQASVDVDYFELPPLVIVRNNNVPLMVTNSKNPEAKWDYDDMLLLNLEIIARRMAANPGNLIISSSSDFDSLNYIEINNINNTIELEDYPAKRMLETIIPDNIKSHLVENLKIPESRIVFKSKDSEWLMFRADNPDLLRPALIGKKNIKIQAPLIEVLAVSNKPESELSWVCSLKMNNITFENVAYGNSFPARFIINIDSLFALNRNDLISNEKESEEFQIEISAKSNSGIEGKTAISLPIINSVVTQRNLFEIAGKFYDRYLLASIDNKGLVEMLQNRYTLEHLKSNLTGTKNIIIQYFNKMNPSSLGKAEFIADYLNDYLQKSKQSIPIKLAYKDKSDIISFSQDYSDVLIQVLLEK